MKSIKEKIKEYNDMLDFNYGVHPLKTETLKWYCSTLEREKDIRLLLLSFKPVVTQFGVKSPVFDRLFDEFFSKGLEV